MKSIRSRLGLSYILMILAVWLLVGTISIFYLYAGIEQHSTTSMNFLLEQKVTELNTGFDALSSDVKYLKSYIERQASFDEDFYEELKKRATIALDDQNLVKTFFFCPDFEATDSTKCLFLLNYVNGEPHHSPLDRYNSMPSDAGKFFDLSFDKNSVKKQGSEYYPWLSVAKQNQFAMWYGPYINYNSEHSEPAICYFEPVLVDNEFRGVVGIEINNLLLRTIIDNIDYGEAFTFLVSNSGDIVYHRDFKSGDKTKELEESNDFARMSEFFSDEYVNSGKTYRYEYKGENHRIILKNLKNGMLLALSVPESQLFALENQMMLQMAMMLIFSLLVSFFVVNLLTEKIVKPIEIITEATSYIAHGELNTKIPIKSDDELGHLASSILKIEVELSEYIEHIRSMAYTDFMTGCKNKSAYLKKLSQIESRIAEDMAGFTVFVFDVNGLKRINDTQGHEMGDELIKAAASSLKMAFAADSIFRTGGDEFVVILENKDNTEESISENVKSFEQAVQDFNAENKADFTLSVSMGRSSFEKGIDRSYKSVADRADKSMYDAKEAFYKEHDRYR